MVKAGHEVIPPGIQHGNINGIEIATDKDIDSVALYINPHIQEAYCDYLIHLEPKSIIFNPGSENMVLLTMASKKGIEVLRA